jgi:hypothetical protein
VSAPIQQQSVNVQPAIVNIQQTQIPPAINAQNPINQTQIPMNRSSQVHMVPQQANIPPLQMHAQEALRNSRVIP